MSVEAIGGNSRIMNGTDEPQLIRKNDHLCQLHITYPTYTDLDRNNQSNDLPVVASSMIQALKAKPIQFSQYHSDALSPPLILRVDHALLGLLALCTDEIRSMCRISPENVLVKIKNVITEKDIAEMNYIDRLSFY